LNVLHEDLGTQQLQFDLNKTRIFSSAAKCYNF
jgi:hypothetical protein